MRARSSPFLRLQAIAQKLLPLWGRWQRGALTEGVQSAEYRAISKGCAPSVSPAGCHLPQKGRDSLRGNDCGDPLALETGLGFVMMIA